MTKNKDLLFNEDLHQYSLLVDGEYQIIPGVTEILDSSGIVDLSYVDSFILDKARKRGHDIHKITELHDRGEVSIPDDFDQHKYYPYLQAWCRFLADYDPEINAIEVKTYSRKYLYAGTIDRVFVLEDQEGEPKNYIVDIKCGGKYASYPIQLAAYRYAYIEQTGTDEGFGRMCVYLKKDGTYEVDTHKNPNDIDVFLSALTVVKWKDANGSYE